MPQLGVRALNLALVALCSFQLAGVFNRVAEDVLRPAPRYATEAPAVAATASSVWDDRKVILDRNLFGAQIVAQPVVARPVEPVEETKLPLVLEATISASGESYSRAAIRDSAGVASMVLGVGDPVTGHAGVTVESIERGRVVLLNAGRREELLLDEGDSSAGVSKPSSIRSRGRKPVARSRASRSSRRAPRPNPPEPVAPDSADVSQDIRELSRRLRSGELTRDQLGETIREQIRSGGLSSRRFGDVLEELGEEEMEIMQQQMGGLEEPLTELE